MNESCNLRTLKSLYIRRSRGYRSYSRKANTGKYYRSHDRIDLALPLARKEAIFWLCQSKDPKALDYLTKLITPAKR